MEKNRYKILSGSTDFHLPIVLESSVDEMGIMVGFDGYSEQEFPFCNFTYSGSGNTVRIYISVNTDTIKPLLNSEFSIKWGDNTANTVMSIPSVYTDLPYAEHTYSISNVTYNVELTVKTQWSSEKVSKTIYVPFTGNTYPVDYTLITGNTNETTISFLALGKSRLSELKNYGRVNSYSGITVTSEYTGYTIDNLYYMDYPGGYTHITGDTSLFYDDEVYNGMITRDEHLIGFIELPAIYSDIFIERGKQGVMERNLRLGEIDNLGELQIYGGGFFNVKKQ